MCQPVSTLPHCRPGQPAVQLIENDSEFGGQAYTKVMRQLQSLNAILLITSIGSNQNSFKKLCEKYISNSRGLQTYLVTHSKKNR